jgi:hypothetical protein
VTNPALLAEYQRTHIVFRHLISEHLIDLFKQEKLQVENLKQDVRSLNKFTEALDQPLNKFQIN